jgi:hypothetical protein
LLAIGDLSSQRMLYIVKLVRGDNLFSLFCKLSGGVFNLINSSGTKRTVHHPNNE